MEQGKPADVTETAPSGPAAPLALGADEVHVWLVDPEVATDEQLRAAYWRLLSVDERAACERLRVARGRQQFLAAHVLLRTALSRHTGVDPVDWVFEKNSHGRPEIVAPRRIAPLRFNLSHTDGLVACGVTLGRDIGVDVEQLRPMPRHLALARRFFAPAEAEALATWPAEGRDARFLEYWTLKESYIKARGLGLSLPLQRFGFELRPDAPIRVSFDAVLGDDARQWEFALRRPTSSHVLALAARRDGAERLRIALRRTSIWPEDTSSGREVESPQQ
jgi:4'-phosphopantetheinyl transferase